MDAADIRWMQRFENFNRAFAQLRKATDLAAERPLSELEQHGLIQAFEFTHELAWNVLKDFLEAEGVAGILGSPSASREAFQRGLVDDGEVWMEMLQARNKSVHAYDGETAEKIAEAVISRFVPEFEGLRA